MMYAICHSLGMIEARKLKSDAHHAEVVRTINHFIEQHQLMVQPHLKSISFMNAIHLDANFLDLHIHRLMYWRHDYGYPVQGDYIRIVDTQSNVTYRQVTQCGLMTFAIGPECSLPEGANVFSIV